ncbi:ParM/StbA family protein (plasmid) [Paenibacillus thiaminolyticus]|uniref:ParM/StbA family protein n=1 Tax=Paenibacillus thiaminolyticus TaxID=49283 RepID=UPI00232E7E79|nr:ParM/StbA family protein [Paenibacillus thiaminolyticus]WCF11463.1 ParM/StbA family protein [Paenibacillus thiaminolyticus]
MAKAVEEPKRRNIAIDSGKNTSKAVEIVNSKVAKRFDVATKMNDTDEKISTSKSSYVVRFNGVSKMIGGLKGKYNYDTSKAQEVHRRATYLSISKLAENNEKIILSIGCPLSVWFNPLAREAYKRYMLNLDDSNKLDVNEGDIPLSFEVDAEEYNFTIEHLLVYPETSGYLIKNEERYIGRSVAVVDIGGLNINGVVYQPTGEDGTLEPNEDTYFTTNEGGNIFVTKLMKELNTQFGTNIQEYEIPEILKKGFIKVDKDRSAQIIQDFTSSYIENVRQEMKAHSWSVETLDFIFTGGGSILFKDSILEIPAFCDAEFSENPVWDNAEGFGVATEDVFAEYV